MGQSYVSRGHIRFILQFGNDPHKIIKKESI
jgi:hypothetical protein